MTSQALVSVPLDDLLQVLGAAAQKLHYPCRHHFDCGGYGESVQRLHEAVSAAARYPSSADGPTVENAK